jgi:hypothetical protein
MDGFFNYLIDRCNFLSFWRGESFSFREGVGDFSRRGVENVVDVFRIAMCIF